MSRFGGFPVGTLKFLRQLQRNNDRDWFKTHKDRYDRDVLEPALAFIAAMADPLQRISPHFHAIPKRTGGSLMRVYRDTRFSKDKRPYKTNVGIQFRHVRGRDVHAPGFYIHIEPGQCFLAAGVWHPGTTTLTDIRQAIVDSPDLWTGILSGRDFRKHFALAGASLKRPPRGFSGDEPHIDDLKRKDFIAVCDVDEAFFGSASVIRDTTARLQAAAPLMDFLCGAMGIEF